MYSFKHLYASMRSKMCLAIIFPCQESPYEGGRFQLKILCSASYPYAAPQAVGWSIWRPLVEIMGWKEFEYPPFSIAMFDCQRAILKVLGCQFFVESLLKWVINCCAKKRRRSGPVVLAFVLIRTWCVGRQLRYPHILSKSDSFLGGPVVVPSSAVSRSLGFARWVLKPKCFIPTWTSTPASHWTTSYQR